MTENSDPDKLSVIENNSPLLPITVNTGCADPEPITVNIDPDAVLVEPCTAKQVEHLVHFQHESPKEQRI